MDSEYKEGREFILSNFIKQGSYGEVYSAQDLNTGYNYAVKKVSERNVFGFFSPLSDFKVFYVNSYVFVCNILSQIALKRFSSEEVGAWSTLRSPRVVELFGVIRNGPYVLLLMDQKSGKLVFISSQTAHFL